MKVTVYRKNRRIKAIRNFFRVLEEFLTETWNIHNRPTPRGKEMRQARSIQRKCTAFWFVTSLLTMLLAFTAPFQGMMYSIASLTTRCTIDTENKYLLDGILFDMGTAVRELLVEETIFGRFMEALSDFDFIQAILGIACIIAFFAAVAFVISTGKIFFRRFGLIKKAPR